MKKILSVYLVITILFANAFSASGQTWNLAGNAGNDPLNHFLGTSDGVHLPFRTNNIVRMIIDENGLVGIGTVTPQYPLDINGALRVGSLTADPASANGVLYYNTSSNSIRTYVNGSWQSLVMGDAAFTSNRIPFGNASGTGLTSSQALSMVFGSNAAALVLTQTGAGGGAEVFLHGNRQIRLISGGTDYPFTNGFGIYDHDAGLTRLYIDPNGLVGIGTTTPTASLDVNGTMRVGSLATAPSGSNGMIYYNSSSNTFAGYRNGAWKNLLTDDNGIQNQFIASQNADFWIHGYGTVDGIFQVGTLLKTPSIYAQGSLGAPMTIKLNAANGNYIEYGSTTGNLYSNNDANKLITFFGNNTNITLLSGQSLSVLNESPNIILNGGQNTGGMIYGFRFDPTITDNSGGSSKVYAFSASKGIIQAQQLAAPTGQNYQVTVNDQGEFASQPITSSNSLWGTGGNTGTTASTNFIGTQDNADLVFKTNGQEAMRILANGQIAIGTTDPKSYQLAVNGSAIFTKVKVQTYSQWADYVFDSSYQLPNLSELAVYIHHNRHLPEIPSAAEVAINGIDIGDNQSVLLKKIEELTLYLIQADARIRALEQQNDRVAQLEEQVRQLQKLITK